MYGRSQSISCLVGERIGRFQIISLLGEGGYSKVYKATDTDTKQVVALKVVNKNIRSQRVHLLKDVEMLTLGVHPIAPKIVAYEIIDNKGCLAMELVEGEDLGDRIDSGIRIPLYQAIEIVLVAAHVLNAYHNYREWGDGKGILYRDLKPKNLVLSSNGVVRLLDFGLVCNKGYRDTGGLVRGSPYYMSPEQARGKRLDQRSDIYNFGLTFQEIVEGENPFDNECNVLGRQADLNEAVPPLKEESVLGRFDFDLAPPRLKPKVELVYAGFKALISKAVKKEIDERNESFTEIIPQLQALRVPAIKLFPFEGRVTI